MPYHPEAKENETFVGNFYRSAEVPRLPLRSWPTARIATVAYDLDGGILPGDSFAALIIGDADLPAYNAHMDAKFNKTKYGRPR